jgi:hypothetical protein
MTHSLPQASPAQGSGRPGQMNGVPWMTQAPVGSQTFSTAVSAQCLSQGAQARHQAPQAFQAQGS